MREYSYIGVAEVQNDGYKFLVRSNDCPIHNENIVEIKIDGNIVLLKVLHAAFLQIGSEEEAMLAEIGEIHDVEKIYACAWDKKKEEEKNGN